MSPRLIRSSTLESRPQITVQQRHRPSAFEMLWLELGVDFAAHRATPFPMAWADLGATPSGRRPLNLEFAGDCKLHQVQFCTESHLLKSDYASDQPSGRTLSLGTTTMPSRT